MALEALEPKCVFGFFEQLCAIPHGSGNTKAISDWCVEFARQRGLEHYQDALNNVIIIKPAAPGYESAPPMILQGHLDMVCAAEDGCTRDLRREGPEPFADGDFVRARGTTLGGDDGIAVAMALAVLDDPALSAPRIEAVFTVDEETGMYGSAGIDLSPLRGRTMLNLDSEEEGVFTVGCAGGAKVNLRWQAVWETAEGVPVTLSAEGLTGGHSGTEINKGRANANILMGRVLRTLSRRTALRLVRLHGGTADNVIPLACCAEILVGAEGVDAVIQTVEELAEVFRNEFRTAEPGLCLRAQIGAETNTAAFTPALSAHIIQALTLAPNGVQAMSRDIPGLAETSLNLGIMELDETQARLCFSVRSSVGSRKCKLVDRLRCIAEVTGAEAAVSGEYPAWEYRADSPLRERMTAIYRRQYGAEPVIAAIHAGLECGLLCEKLPGLDCVSIGPDLPDIHTVKERMSISSVQRVWEFVKEILKESK